MKSLRIVVRSLDQRQRLARWHARGFAGAQFAWAGWRLGAARERLDDRRKSLARALGR